MILLTVRVYGECTEAWSDNHLLFECCCDVPVISGGDLFIKQPGKSTCIAAGAWTYYECED